MLLQSQIRSFFETYPFPSFIINIDDHFTIAEVNKAYLNTFPSCCEKEQLKNPVGQSLFQLFPNNSDRFNTMLDRILATKKSFKTDIMIRRPANGDTDGENIHYSLPVLTPVLNDQEEVDLVICSLISQNNQGIVVKERSAENVLQTDHDQDDWQKQKEKQELLDKAYRLADIGIWEFDMQTHKLQWSDITKEVHGFGPDYEPDVESTINLFKEGVNRQQFAEAARGAIEEEKPFDVELKIISGQGDERWIRATGEPEYNNGVCTRFYGISQNVTDRRKAEEELLLSERRFRSLVQDGSDLVAILDQYANYEYVSPTSESVLGIPAEDLVGTNALDYIHPDDHRRITEIIEQLSSGQRRNIAPFRFKNAEGNWRWIETTLTNMTEDPAVGGLVANSRDVTENKWQQQKIWEALKEKETLLAEIHHRVKNNLAVVSGMMQLQITEEDGSRLTDKLQDSIVRIKTMANIHEQLYQSKSFSQLEFTNNIRSLVMDIQKTLQSDTKVQIDFDCEPVLLNINQAIPCSLIVNEVVTNIFKHAFPGRAQGNIYITLSISDEDKQLHLSINDDGIGLPDEFDKSDVNSLGLNLIDVLSQQLEAKYRYEPGKEGTTFMLQFQKDSQKGIGNNLL